MKTFNVHEAKTNFSKLLNLIGMGEQVVISKSGKPVALMSPYRSSETTSERKPGLFKGKIKFGDDFFAPLDPEFMKHFT